MDRSEDISMEDSELKADKGPVWFKSQRYILAYMLSTGFMILFLLRFNFSIAIVCMVNHTAVAMEQTDNHELYNQQHNSNDHNLANATISKREDDKKYRGIENLPTHSNNSCGNSFDYSTSQKEDGPMVWDKQTQGILLGAVFWTYAVLMVPANHVLRNVSRKRLIAISMAAMSLLSMLMHMAALWSPWAVFVIKLGQGCFSPLCSVALYGMWTDWAPPQERAGLITLCFSGVMVSNAIVFPTSAMLCKYGFLGGWPSIFYVFGMVGILWTVLFMFLTSDSPASHPRISDKERHYIQSSLAGRPKTTSTKVPWMAIVRSPAVWGYMSSHVSTAWGLFLFLTTLPQYMKEVLKFDIRVNGLYSTFPYMSMMMFALLSGQCADMLHRRKLLRLITIRKCSQILANIVPAILLCILSYLDCAQWALAVGLLTLAFGFSGIGFSVYPVNPYDIAPRLAQSVITWGNFISGVSAIAAPYMVTTLTKHGTRGEWQLVMFFTAGVFVAGAIGFCLLGNTDEQEWAKAQPKDQALIGQNSERGEVSMEPNVEENNNI